MILLSTDTLGIGESIQIEVIRGTNNQGINLIILLIIIITIYIIWSESNAK